jgi:FAD/FMN-containing dehydrogenase
MRWVTLLAAALAFRAEGAELPDFGNPADAAISKSREAQVGRAAMLQLRNAGVVDDADEVSRAREAERVLFEGVVSLEGSISGEHGIGFTKAPFLSIELSPDEIALMRRVKAAFDPEGLLNPGKIFPPGA